MSIDDDLQPKASITEGDRALSLFTDRYSFTRLLAERLNDLPAKEILFFHGAGGNGKSLLMKYLQKNICKRLTAQQWAQWQGGADEALAQKLEGLSATQCLPVPTALLDFGLQPLGEVQPRDRFYGLLLLRKALGESAAGNYALKFARYDFACIWYLSQKGKSLEEIRGLFPLNEVAGAATTAVDALTGGAVGGLLKAMVDFGVQGWTEKLAVQLARRGVDRETQDRIRGLDVDCELIDQLPQLFAQDLNAAMARADSPERMVLLFDTHESFWGAQRNLPRETYFFQDEWLRRLLRQLDLEKGIVVIVAGRDVPQWPQAKAVRPGTEIPQQYLQLKEVGHLAVADARAYLQNVGIEDGVLQESLVAYACVNPQADFDQWEVHPLHLGLCTDVVLAARADGQVLTATDFEAVPDFEEKGAQLIERLLRYVDEGMRYGIHALSACRAFDEGVYRLLGETLNFVADHPTFVRLTNFSFVWRARQRGENWYRIHDLLRRFDGEVAVRQQAHKALAAHYQQEEEIEAIYHVNQLDWAQGVEQWETRFDEALALSRYELCRTLLDLRRELIIQTSFALGRISDCEGQYFQNLSLYEAAEQEYREAIESYKQALTIEPDNLAALNNKSNSLTRLADLQARLSQHNEARARYEQSIAAHDAILHRVPDDVSALKNKGISLNGLANLQASLSQHNEARARYEQSIAAYDIALHHAPDDVQVLNNKGNSLARLADLQASLSQHNEARARYEQSIAAYDMALHRAPDDVQVLNNKGNSLQSLADLQASLSQHNEARARYEQSIVAYDATLHRAPDYVMALNNKGNSLQSLGNLQSILAQYDAAWVSYKQSIDAYDAAFNLAPDDVGVLNNRGNSLQRLAVLQSILAQYDTARMSYKQSIDAYDATLDLAPNDVKVLNNKGNSLQRLAALQVSLAQCDAARVSYEQSIVAYDAAFDLTPENLMALNNKGTSLQGLGDLQTSLIQHDAARVSYEQSITAYDAVLQLAPDDVNAFNNKGNSLAKLANLQAGLAQHNVARVSYEQSIAAYDAALGFAPDYVMALNNKGTSLQCLGDLQSSLAQHNAARVSYEQSIAIYDAVLELAPDLVQALYTKALTLEKLSILQSQQSQEPEAIENLRAALSMLAQALNIAPSNPDIRQRYNQLTQFFTELEVAERSEEA